MTCPIAITVSYMVQQAIPRFSDTAKHQKLANSWELTAIS